MLEDHRTLKEAGIDQIHIHSDSTYGSHDAIHVVLKLGSGKKNN